MLVGTPSVLAIESGITRAYSRPSFKALGWFAIHLRNQVYGRRAPESTMLANSFEEVADRMGHRGRHVAPFAETSDAGEIAEAVRRTIYFPTDSRETFFGIDRDHFVELVHSHELLWAPDGDEAFDDGSYVLQFDLQNCVRLIGFKSAEGMTYQRDTLTDVRLEIDEFYTLLQKWHDSFEAEWRRFPKTPELA